MKDKSITQQSILIVDDIPANLSVLMDFLSKTGFKVLVATDGKSALKKAAYAQPDLILLDVMMPGIDGFQVCKILKSQEQTQEIPIIFMTALSETIDKIKGFNLGAVDYITKPIQHEETLARVNTHLKLRQLQEQLQEQLQISKKSAIELEKRNSELNAFARTVSHDLKNPLNGIIGLSDLLLLPEMQLNETEKTKYLQLINSSGHKMVEIINALLLLAGVSQQQETLEMQPLDMSSIVSQVIEKRLDYMRIQFKAIIELPKKSWPIAMGYAPWIEEIWANYISNAFKYGAKEGETPQIKLGADSPENGMIRFWVRDNGPGISKPAQAQLFTPFTRLHKKKKKVEGHGLGLSIVQQIAEKLHGEAGVESTEGEGSRFYFTLPAMTQNS
jgi:signal transduction histidine kinase